MSKLTKCIHAALVATMLMTFLLAQTNNVQAVGSTVEERTLSFLTDVVMLDLTKYNVTLASHRTSYPAEYGGITQEEVHYKLSTKEGWLDATFTFRNNTLSWVNIDGDVGVVPLYYRQPQSTDLVDKTRALFEKIQEWSGSSHYQELGDILDIVDKAENATVTLGNTKLGIETKGQYTYFRWVYSYDGLEKPGPHIAFRNGDFEGFNDNYNIFKVGTSTVSISKEEAISIAMDRTKNFSWKVGLEPNATEITKFTILEKSSIAELSMQAREPLTLYPFWRVDLVLDKMYPGNVGQIAVGIWADTGGVRYITPLSTGGGAMPNGSSSSTPPQDNGAPNAESDISALSTGTYAIVATSIILVVAASIAIILRKRAK